MTNPLLVRKSEELSKIFDNAGDKLIVLLFYTKRNGECKRALSAFENSAINHHTSIFCVIDTDNWTGENRIVNISNITNMPKFEAFYQGNSLGTRSTHNEKEIEEMVCSSERYVMTQNNNKNTTMTQNNILNPMTMANNCQFNPMTQQQQLYNIQQQILNQARMTNPQQFQFYVQNPQMLLQQAQLQLNQQMMMPNTMIPNTMIPNTMVPNNMTQNSIPSAQIPLMLPNNNINTSMPQQNSNNNIIPTFEQMQQMFRIFQMMQQMGALNMPTGQECNTISNTNITNNIPAPTIKPMESEGVIDLPNGSKLIPLADGRYGLIEKKN